jgi:putative NADPH-quinone reductase
MLTAPAKIEKKKIFILSFDFNDESFGKIVVSQIKKQIKLNVYDFDCTELQNSNFKLLHNYNTENEELLRKEFDKLLNCTYFYIIFPYTLTGIPSIVKDWFDKIFNYAFKINKLPLMNQTKALLICTTDFPEESFQPNSLHRSTMKRRLHHLFYGMLKANGIKPLEPLFFYNYLPAFNNYQNSKSSNNGSVSLNIVNLVENGERDTNREAKKEDKVEFDSSNAVSHSLIFKKSKKNKEAQAKEDFLTELGNILNTIDDLNEIDISEL